MRLVLIGIWLSLTLSLFGQKIDTTDLESIQISVLTCGPGDQLYSLFGHTALRISQRPTQYERVYNWGTFDFDTPGFAIKFLRGKLDYALSVTSTSNFAYEYNRDKRYVDEQILQLDPRSKRKLLELVAENYTKENRFYKYDFFFDNCTTRIRDLLDESTGGVTYGSFDQTDITFRGLLHSHLGDYPWTKFGMDLILGKKTDAHTSPRDQMFLPIYFYDYVNTASVNNDKMVSEDRTLLDFVEARPSTTWFTPLVVFWGLFTVELISFFLYYISGHQGYLKWHDKIWFSILSLSGLLIAFMWFFTDHEVCKANYNLAWTIPWTVLGIWKNGKIRKTLFSLSFIICAGLLIGWAFIPQSLPAAVIPIILISLLKCTRQLDLITFISPLRSPAITTCITLACIIPSHAQERIAGITVVAPPSEFRGDPMQEVTAVHANWVALVPYGFSRPGEPKVQWGSKRQWWGERVEGIKESIRLAKKNNLQIMLKPQVWIPRGWVGDMDFENEGDWNIWEVSYREYIMTYVDLAVEYDIEMLCVGTEYRIAAKKREKFWRALIEDIRKKYDGLLTYSSNWDSYKKIPFWDDLDFIGISGYFPLSELETPPVMLLTYKWKKPISQLERYSKKLGKRILFTEYGYLSVDGAAGKTWELESQVTSLPINEEAQANSYAALFKAFEDEEFWAGAFLWKWFPEGHGHEGYPERDYTPQGKKAEKVLAEWHKKIVTGR